MKRPDSPLDALFAAYVAGRLAPAYAALLAAHLALKPDNRPFVHALGAAQGLLLDAIAPVALAAPRRILAAILKAPAQAAVRASVADQADGLVPPVLARFIGRPLAALDWIDVEPGLRRAVVSAGAGPDAFLVRSRAGKRLGRHSHAGNEATLVLQGGFGDAFGHYLRGDIALYDESINHRPVCDPNEECILFVVRDGPIYLTDSIDSVIERLAPV